MLVAAWAGTLYTPDGRNYEMDAAQTQIAMLREKS